MIRLPFTLAATCAAVLALTALVPPETTSALQARSSGTTPAAHDTLTASVEAGMPLVLALPEGGAYEIVRAPALSWLIQRSFYWDTQPADTGRTDVLIRRSVDARFDTLHVIVQVQ